MFGVLKRVGSAGLWSSHLPLTCKSDRHSLRDSLRSSTANRVRVVGSHRIHSAAHVWCAQTCGGSCPVIGTSVADVDVMRTLLRDFYSFREAAPFTVSREVALAANGFHERWLRIFVC